MPRPRRETQNGQLHCPACNRWLHPSRFRPDKRHGTVATFHSKCRSCEQSERTDRKNADRALALVSQRAAVRAHAAGVPREFFMDDLNWRALVPEVRLYLDGEESVCRSCGHRPLNERDVQLEHIEPPRHNRDWARHHARNIVVLCGSCNNGKSNKPHAAWLDEQEDARLSVAAYYGVGPAEPVRPPELTLSGPAPGKPSPQSLF